MRVKMNQVGVKIGRVVCWGSKKVVKREQRGSKEGAKRYLSRSKLRPGGGLEGVEEFGIDFEFCIPHATHEALGLGRRMTESAL